MHAATAEDDGPCEGKALYRPAAPHPRAEESGAMRDENERGWAEMDSAGSKVVGAAWAMR